MAQNRFIHPPLLSLVPLNDRARAATSNPKNRHIAYKQDTGDNGLSLAIGPHIKPRGGSTLATFGRAGTDVILPGRDISLKHCSFEIMASSGSIMVHDLSSNGSIRFTGPTAFQFQPGFLRRVVIAKGVNEEICLGHVGRDPYLFRIVWHQEDSEAEANCGSSSMAMTLRESEGEALPDLESPTRIPVLKDPSKFWYLPGKKIGAGGFGEVHRAVNPLSGVKMALKILKFPAATDPARSGKMKYIKREVKALKSLNHPSFDGSALHLFTTLKTGSIEQLMEKNVFETGAITITLLHHMLQAIDYTASLDYIHRDVKPANILFSVKQTGKKHASYHFQLTDFGFVNQTSVALSLVGTRGFYAPEMITCTSPQTPKVDVWALFATIAYAANQPRDFRENFLAAVNDFTGSLVQQAERPTAAVLDAASASYFDEFRSMAAVDPDERPSAGDLIDALFGGEGRITPRTSDNTAHPRIKEISEDQGDGGTVELPAARTRGDRVSRRRRNGTSEGAEKKLDLSALRRRKLSHRSIVRGKR